MKVANIVALGAVLSFEKDLFKEETILRIFKETFLSKDILNANIQGFLHGKKIIEQITDMPVVFHHAVRIDPETRLAFGLLLEVREHAPRAVIGACMVRIGAGANAEQTGVQSVT